MKKAVVTGATKGIGRAIVLKLANEGFDVAFCARTQSDLDQFKAELERNYDGRFIAQVVDMGKKEDIIRFGQLVKEEMGSVDLLVNNAGVFIPCELLNADNEDAFTQMMDVNLYSTYYMTQQLIEDMIKVGKGHIFNMCSIASIMPYGAYAVSKHAMLGYSRVLREELKEKGVRVTAIMPGAVYTASWDGTTIPEERMMKAEDIADSVWSIFALSDRTVVEEIVLRPQLGDI